MSEQSERYRKVAAQFDARVRAVPAEAWDNPAPPEGWVARDIIGHLGEWIPGFFADTFEIEVPPLPSAADDPVGLWAVLDATVQTALDLGVPVSGIAAATSPRSLPSHRRPPDLVDPAMASGWAVGVRYRRLLFPSGFRPRDAEPGHDRWAGYEANRTAVATVLEHPGPPRPWVIAIHGLALGYPSAAFVGLAAMRPHTAAPYPHLTLPTNYPV